MLELIEQNHALVVPHFHALVRAARGYQSQVMTVGATSDLFLVSVWLATFNKLGWQLMMHLFVHVYLNRPIPATRDDSMVIGTIANERDFTLSLIMFLKLQDLHARLEIVDFKFTLMATHNKFPVLLVEYHLRDFGREYVFDHSNGLTSTSIPDLDIFLSSYKNFEAFFGEKCPTNSLVICEIRNKRSSILENRKIPGSAN